MKTFNNHLKQKVKNTEFRNLFEEEKVLADLSLKIHDEREKLGLSQQDVANKAHITQQQLSKIENGINCNIVTFLKVCKALNIEFYLKNRKVAC